MFRDESLGLYEFIDGVPLAPGDVTWKEVEQLITFLGELFNCKDRPGAQKLPTAWSMPRRWRFTGKTFPDDFSVCDGELTRKWSRQRPIL